MTAPATDVSRKTLENRIRRMAQRHGLEFHRSRRRDPFALDYRACWLADEYGRVVAGDVLTAHGDLNSLYRYLTGLR